jgi:Fic family protein
MDPARFVAPQFGKVEREAGNRWSFWYFLPAPIPRALDLAPATVLALSEADASLGHLQGLGHLVSDPELLLGPYLTREAVASSRIEGTQASLSDVLKAAASAGNARTEDIQEVERYVSATRHGLELISGLPIAQRMVLEIHRVLLAGVRGPEKLPGEFRRSPVWVGSTTDSPDTATFVPPLHGLIGDLFADWERFVNEPCPLPVLIRCALMHYQFETIHPFLDGNGRIGRLLVGLMLIQERRLTTPLLYLSGYLERNRHEYYDRLQAVRERGEIQEWLQFFLTAINRQADDAVVRASGLVALRQKYTTASAAARSRIGALVDLMFANPFLTVSRVENALGMTNQGARNLLRDASRRGWLEELGLVGRGGRAYWVAHEIWRISEDEPSFSPPVEQPEQVAR